MVYNRGGYAPGTLRALDPRETRNGMQPKGHGAWHVTEAIRKTVRSERGRTEGIIGTLKTDEWIRQAQGTSVADVGDGTAAVCAFVQSQQIDAGCGTGQQVRIKSIRGRRAEKVALIERQGGQELPHCSQRSFATRSK